LYFDFSFANNTNNSPAGNWPLPEKKCFVATAHNGCAKQQADSTRTGKNLTSTEILLTMVAHQAWADRFKFGSRC
jgi:hypothetical protein